jgi:hypothetical protein
MYVSMMHLCQQCLSAHSYSWVDLQNCGPHGRTPSSRLLLHLKTWWCAGGGVRCASPAHYPLLLFRSVPQGLQLELVICSLQGTAHDAECESQEGDFPGTSGREAGLDLEPAYVWHLFKQSLQQVGVLTCSGMSTACRCLCLHAGAHIQASARACFMRAASPSAAKRCAAVV